MVVVYSVSVRFLTTSINACSKEEMLDDWHNLDLTQVEEELVEFFLVSAVQDQV